MQEVNIINKGIQKKDTLTDCIYLIISQAGASA